MRVRVKVPGWQRVLKFDAKELEELQKSVAAVVRKTKSGSALPMLSLNRRDPLTEESFQSVVSGDTLWVLEANENTPCQPRPDLSGGRTGAACARASSNQDTSANSPRLCPELEDCMSQQAHTVAIPTFHLCISAFSSAGWKPLLGDAKGLEDSKLIYREYDVPEKEPDSDQPSYTVSVWFDLVLPRINLVHARRKTTANEWKSTPWSISLPKEIKNDRDVALKHWILVKDHLCMRVENLCIFTKLPYDIRLKCLENLDLRDLVSVSLTCKILHADANSESLWQKLWMKMGRSDIGEAKSYRNAVVNAICMEKKRKRDWAAARKSIGRLVFGSPGNNLPIFPGVIGGDYDRSPNFNRFF